MYQARGWKHIYDGSGVEVYVSKDNGRYSLFEL